MPPPSHRIRECQFAVQRSAASQFGTSLGLLLIFSLCAAGDAGARQTGFGSSVAIAAEMVAVGKTLTLDGPGEVYIYGQDGEGTWAEHQRLSASDAAADTNHFGRALAGDSRRLFVGAPGSDAGRGAVYVYALRQERWIRVARLAASDAGGARRFGTGVAADGPWLLVSAVGDSAMDDAVYVFRQGHSEAEWQEHTVFRARDFRAERVFDTRWQAAWHASSPPVPGFGASLAISGHMAAIGSPLFGGSAVVLAYDAGADAWQARGHLSVDGLALEDRFGYALAAQDEEIFVGAPGYGDGQGAVFLFSQQGDSRAWRLRQRFAASDSAGTPAGLGSALAVFDGALLSGAPLQDSAMGTTYLFERAGSGDWHPAGQVRTRDADGELLTVLGLGWAVDMSGGILVAGAPNADYRAGKAYAFERTGGRFTERGALTSELARLNSIMGESVDCTEGQAALFACGEVDLLSFVSTRDLGGKRGVVVNDVWGWTDPETGDEWALVGRIDGTSFVRVTDPQNPVLVGNLPKTAGAGTTIWRDIKVYRDHAYVVSDAVGAHGMQVFDLRRLRSVPSPPVTFEATGIYDRIASAHNIAINEETGFAYSTGGSEGGETCGGGLHMIDIRNPAEPRFAGCFADTATGMTTPGYSHDVQCVVYEGPDAAYRGREICFSSNETALSIVDVTDKDEPVKLSSATYPNAAYAHQGWLTSDQRYFYMNDELDEIQGSVHGTRTLIWDVADLGDPYLANEHVSESAASDHNLYIAGDVMYQSNFQSGLHVLDISDRLHPVEIGFFDTVPQGDNLPGYGGSWSNYPFFESGIILVTSRDEGLFILSRRGVDT